MTAAVPSRQDEEEEELEEGDDVWRPHPTWGVRLGRGTQPQEAVNNRSPGTPTA